MKVYVSHSIRGKKGKDATSEEMKANNQKAIAFGIQIRATFPGIEFYIPGEHDELISLLYHNGTLTEDDILRGDCKIIDGCDFLINYMPDSYLSIGMKVENIHAGKQGMATFNVYSNDMDTEPIKVIQRYIESKIRG